MGRVFSVDLDEKCEKALATLMGKFPKKSRNGVIRHIINTYSTDTADLLWRLENQESISNRLRERLDALDSRWSDKYYQE